MTDAPFVILVAGESASIRAKTVLKLQDALGPFRVVEPDSMWEAARQCEAPAQVDFIVVDNDLVERVGTRFLSGLSALQPAALLVVFGPPRARSTAIKILEAGAAAYLPHDLAPPEIAKAFDVVLSGAMFAPIPPATSLPSEADAAPRALVLPFLGASPDPAHLSTSERDIMALLARWRSNAEIAFLLGRSKEAVSAEILALMAHWGRSEPPKAPRKTGSEKDTADQAADHDDRPH